MVDFRITYTLYMQTQPPKSPLSGGLLVLFIRKLNVPVVLT